ncbi:unnamed protein product [Angiostrongylus costaricensis]|uniref:Ral guanine nucleotide dissociation stimulator-like 2 n=1 Tax=Angiostrongylus costaricensis TaxID=334426 RepID=A0A158PI31_ANGCS|nr:unnamed protein product [Angiostrongylus costaricensis]
MAMVKYWGDEKHADAIYAVYLKKVRYVPPAGYDGVPRYRAIDPDRPQLHCPCSGSDHLQWESVKERESLVASDGTVDSRHFNVFFATYRAFTEPTDVLDRLLRRYESLEKDVNTNTSALVIQNSIRSILVCWLDMYSEDFYDPSCNFAMLTNLLDFGQRCKLSDLRAKSRKLLERFKHIQEEGGMIASLPSLDQLAYAFGYDAVEYSKNPRERVKMFDVGSENCVQIAEQLTFWDAELFRELIIHQCQGCVWSKRHRLGNDKVYTVKATIDQFNAVSQRVMTSIVLPDCRPDFRAKIIAKWIDIARELRALKNFSSLKAVLSSLQSEPVHRLKSSWALVPSRYLAQFRDLSSIYDMDEVGDERNARRILEQEGTAKSSPLRRPQLVQNCRRTKSDVNLAECQGTVPYLEGLINFEKRRKEFEVLAKLRLFQSAARAYHIPMDRVFCAWFHFLPCLSEKDFSRSLEVELPPLVSTPDLGSHHNTSLSNGNLSAASKSSTLSRLFNTSRLGDETGLSSVQPGTLSHSTYVDHVLETGILAIDAGASKENTNLEEWIDGRVDGGPPGPASTCSSSSYQSSGAQEDTSSFHLARVGLDDDDQASNGCANYKCIKVKNGDRMSELVSRALEKHLLDHQEGEYCLVQLLPNGDCDFVNLKKRVQKCTYHIDTSDEFQLPDKCNPYYAMAPDPSSTMLNLLLRCVLLFFAITDLNVSRKRKDAFKGDSISPHVGSSTKKLNKMKRSNLLRWSSGYL